jgi:hypothetical protein
LGRSADGLTTTASSCECPSGVAKKPNGGTIAASSFGLSPSLKKKSFDVKKKGKSQE